MPETSTPVDTPERRNMERRTGRDRRTAPDRREKSDRWTVLDAWRDHKLILRAQLGRRRYDRRHDDRRDDYRLLVIGPGFFDPPR